MATIKATVRKEDNGDLLLVFKNSKGTEPYYECFDGGGHCDLELFYLTIETNPVRSSDTAAILAMITVIMRKLSGQHCPALYGQRA